MPLPTRVLTGSYPNAVTGQAHTGAVDLEPYPSHWHDTAGKQVRTGGGTIALVAGAFSQALVTTDAAGVNPPTGRLWRIKERLDGQPVRTRYFLLPLGDGTPLDVTQVVEADPAQLTYLPAQGPPGADGTAAVTAHAAASDPHGDRAAAATALTAHEADTTGVHGIADTAVLETQAGATAKITTHAAAADPHGDRAFATSAVSTHTGAADPHGDRAWADSRFARLAADVIGSERLVQWAVDQVLPSTTLTDCTHGDLTVSDGARYAIESFLNVDGDPASDLAMTFQAPAGSSGGWTPAGITLGNTDGTGSTRLTRFAFGASSSLGVIAAGCVLRPSGSLIVAGTAGQLRMQAARAAGGGGDVTIRAGSWLKLTRIA